MKSNIANLKQLFVGIKRSICGSRGNFRGLVMVLLLISGSKLWATTCPSPWLGVNDSENCDLMEYAGVSIRAGYFPENPNAEFKGNILYLEGLGDSMVNHAPLFKNIARKGYRVIAFDYPGHGGSQGSINNFSIQSLADIALTVNEKYRRNDAKANDTVIGWSTGGLVAYKLANDKAFKQVILLAPALAPKLFTGEGFPLNEISLRTLTRNRFIDGTQDPHIDPIRPPSPLESPRFALHLLKTARDARTWKISDEVRGLAILSGPEDRYVDTKVNAQKIKKNASHFRVQEMPNSLHELDNELPDIAQAVNQTITDQLWFWSTKK